MDAVTLALSLKKSKAYTDSKIDALPKGVVYKGSVANEASLPTNATKGDAYTALDTGNEYVWDGSTWVNFGIDSITTQEIDNIWEGEDE